MEEKYIYIPKPYFYMTAIIFLIITVALVLDLYLIGKNFYDLYLIIIFIAIFTTVLIFSYLSYKGKIPYLVEYEGNFYASKYQVILTIIIFLFLFMLIPYIYMDKSIEAIITSILIIAIGIITVVFTYLSYKKKIPLLRFRY